ncbi:hypothetical protein [Methyloceanibacter sp.]|uniref:hypothetical protein n=1 Tax=Methyloceanibacter sp. TaxID=1965321 RepID=UPI002D3A57FD|nr:hypothetical protein [Methyloceanibacter sp.]HZP09658.1 hypothetical protein [Methyloceanibacter sp.]
MDLLTLFGFAAVSFMLLCYALEERSPWYVFGFAVACALSGVYAVLQGALPFGLVEGVFTAVALRRWRRRTRPA